MTTPDKYIAAEVLAGRVALVTGGGQGIGRGVALVLAEAGAAVIVNDIEADICTAVANEIEQCGGKAIALTADIADAQAVSSMIASAVARFGKVDILINNAAMLRTTAPVEEIPEDEWDRLIAVNVKGAFNCTQAVLPMMKKQGWGKIVNVSSVAARSTSNSGGVHYTTSKAALLGFTRHVALEVAPFGINVNAIAPAGVETEMIPRVWAPERIAALVQRIPLHRLATTREIGYLVLFLVTDQSSYITGATIDINGGLLMV